jgi:hypothetical protein
MGLHAANSTLFAVASHGCIVLDRLKVMDDVAVMLARLGVCAAAAYMLFTHHREIRDAVENFTNNFPGAGNPPTHPSPTKDGAFLTRKRGKSGWG